MVIKERKEKRTPVPSTGMNTSPLTQCWSCYPWCSIKLYASLELFASLFTHGHFTVRLLSSLEALGLDYEKLHITLKLAQTFEDRELALKERSFFIDRKELIVFALHRAFNLTAIYPYTSARLSWERNFGPFDAWIDKVSSKASTNSRCSQTL